MPRRSILGSLFSAIFLAALLFFVLFFFVPSLSNSFFHVSYQGMRDTKQLKETVESVLVKARVPQIAVDEYLSKLDETKLYNTIQETSIKGNDILYTYLAKAGEGVEFGELRVEELKQTFKKGFEDTSRYTTRQIDSLKRIFSNVLDNN